MQAKDNAQLCNAQVTGMQQRIMQELRQTRVYECLARSMPDSAPAADALLPEKCTTALLLLDMELKDLEEGEGTSTALMSLSETAIEMLSQFRALLAVDKGSLLESELKLLHRQLHKLQVLDPGSGPSSPDGYSCHHCAEKC